MQSSHQLVAAFRHEIVSMASAHARTISVVEYPSHHRAGTPSEYLAHSCVVLAATATIWCIESKNYPTQPHFPQSTRSTATTSSGVIVRCRLVTTMCVSHAIFLLLPTLPDMSANPKEQSPGAHSANLTVSRTDLAWRVAPFGCMTSKLKRDKQSLQALAQGGKSASSSSGITTCDVFHSHPQEVQV